MRFTHTEGKPQRHDRRNKREPTKLNKKPETINIDNKPQNPYEILNSGQNAKYQVKLFLRLKKKNREFITTTKNAGTKTQDNDKYNTD